jgi:hypothetical protein
VSIPPLIDLLSKGLAYAENDRFRQLSEILNAWQTVKESRGLLAKALPLAVFADAVAVFMVLDYFKGKSLSFPVARMIGIILGSAIPTASALVLAGLRWFNLSLPLVAQRAVRIVEHYVKVVWLVTVVLAALALQVAPGWLEAFNKYGIVDGRGCFVESTDSGRTEIVSDGFVLVELKGENRRLKCEKGVIPLVYAASLLQPKLSRVEFERTKTESAMLKSMRSPDGLLSRDSQAEVSGFAVKQWERPLTEKEMRQRLIRSIRKVDGLATFVRKTLEETLPSDETPVLLKHSNLAELEADNVKKDAVGALRNRLYKMTREWGADDRAARLAIQGHLAALVLDCHAAANNYGLAFDESDINESILSGIFRVWAMDAARCLSAEGADADDVVQRATLKSPQATGEFAGLVIWLIHKTEYWRTERRFLLRGIRLLDASKNAIWGNDRRFFISEAVGNSRDCETVRLGLTLVRDARFGEGGKDRVIALIEEMERPSQGRGKGLGKCNQLLEDLEGAIGYLHARNEVGDAYFSRVQSLVKKRDALQERTRAATLGPVMHGAR